MYINDCWLLEEEEYILIRACVAGNRSCENKLYTKYAGKMMAVCLRYASCKEEAEDILQEGFIKVFTHIREFKKEGSFEGWVRKIMINTALEQYRRRSHLYPLVSLDEVTETSICKEEILSRITLKELIEMIQRLPPASRIVFNLYVFEGFKHREIAKRLGISEGTSKSNLSDARAMLQKKILNSRKITKQEGNK